VRYTPTTEQDRSAMLAAIGVQSVDDLFADIPPALRFTGNLDIPQGIGEAELYRELAELSSRNADATRELQFLGGGTYDHYVPACVDLVTGLPQFQTAYTPYQPEVSQGTLTAIFEFQTAICELTGLSVSNASVYDGATAAAEAMGLAVRQTGRAKIVVSQTVNPETRAVVATYAGGQGIEVVEVPHSGGASDLEAIRGALDGAAALLVQQPGFLGAVDDLPALIEAAHDAGALALASVDPVSLGLLAAPGELGVDVAVGNGQALGNYQAYGGPTFGFMACTDDLMRSMPGRIVGETLDKEGRRAFVLTLQTREQHIRREKATSNICTNQALNALAGIVYLSWLGPRGVTELARQCLSRAEYAKARVLDVPGVEPAFVHPTFKEFAIRVGRDGQEVIRACRERGVHPGHCLGRHYDGLDDVLLVAVTERRTREDCDRLARTLEEVLS
jgi:glycine cleavage system P protein (glycine dehydrogenase) subunit 1